MSGGDITVVGGGWSVLNIALDRLCGRVIAVNDSAVLLPRWDYAVSMDRLWAEHRIDQLVIRSTETTPPREIWLRRSALQNLTTYVASWPWVRSFECDHMSSVFSVIVGRLNGTNSGFCALNLAWQLRPRRVFLLGFDMTRHPHSNRAYWYPPYPWVTAPSGATTGGKYSKWSKEFRGAAASFRRIGCDVFNVSPTSAIDAFPKITPAQYLKEYRA